jgi:hypothetical protein
MKETNHQWFFPELLKLYFLAVSVTSLRVIYDASFTGIKL